MAEERKALGDGTRRAAGGPLPTFLGVNLVTPRGVVAHTDTDAITAPGELGEFELMPGHISELTALKPGVLTIGERNKIRYAISFGYLRVDAQSAVEILVDEAVLGAEVDVETARTEQRAADAELAKWGDRPTDGEYRNVLRRSQWAKAQLDAAAAK